MKKLILLSMLGFSIISANATLYLYEDFTPKVPVNATTHPPLRTINLNSDYTWTQAGTLPEEPNLWLGDLSYLGLQTNSSSNCKVEVGSKSTSASGGTSASPIDLATGASVSVYLSFLLNVADLTNVSDLYTGQVFFHAYNTAGSNIVCISATTDQISRNVFTLTFRGTSAGSIWTTDELSINATHLIVFGTNDMRGATGTSAMDIWINPTVDGTYKTPTASNLWRKIQDTNTLNVRIGDNTGANILPTMYIDEVRVGSDFLSVVPAIPEPTTWVLLGVSLLVVTVLRQRKVS